MKNNACCCVYSILASIIGGIGIAAAAFAGIIPSVLALIIVTLVLGAISLVALVVKTLCGRKRDGIDVCYIAAMVGAIVTSLFALTAIALPGATVAVALLIGAVAYFLIATIINLVKLVTRTVREDESCR